MNISKIRISGDTYQIKDELAPSVVELTQAEYDALPSSAKTSNSLFIITDAQGADLSQYWTSAQTESAITQAVSGKQDTLSAGTGIDITDNVISATGGGGGGKAISAGTNISVTTGETADTINCTLPITKNSYNNGVTLGWNGNNSKNYYAVAEGYNSIAHGGSSHAEGKNTSANTQGSHSEGYATIAGWRDYGGYDQEYCHAEGYQTTAFTYFSHAEGYQNKVQGQASHVEGANNEIINPFGNYTQFSLVGSHAEGKNNKTYNEAEHASGKFNNSVSASTTFGDSGNTLFSVGNGTSSSARHNAFEIRQNGDIYCSDGTNDVKLQDTITATAANTTALGGLKLVKLTQSEYNALQNKDENTLYVVVSAATPTPSWVSYGVGDDVLAGSYSNLRIPSAVTFDDENSHFDIQLSNGDIAHIGCYCTETMCDSWDCAEYDEETGDCIEQGDCTSEYCSIVDEGYCINSSYAFDKDVDSLTHFTFGQDGYWYLNEGFTLEFTGDIQSQFAIEVLPNSI